uniref:Lysosomal thioesterase PPT2 n=1 Tax=Apteryx owenii TaxID=8824 RepID=A0A8B9Q507_APTOW
MPPARHDGTMGRRGGARPWAFLPPLLLLLLGLLLLGLAAPGGSYRPVIVVHGLFDSPADFRHLRAFINEVSGTPGPLHGPPKHPWDPQKTDQGP